MENDLTDSKLRNQLLFSIFLKAIPYLIAIIGSAIRYSAIKNDAIIGDNPYSRLMKAKLTVSYFFAILYVAPIPLAFLYENYWMYNHHYYSILYGVFSFVWIGLAILMTLEHERRLTQAWYGHQFFGIINGIGVIAFSIVGIYKQLFKVDDYVAFSLMSVEVIMSLLIVGFMLKTKSFRIRKLEQRIQLQEQLLSPGNPGEIHISMDYKITKKNEITFRITANKIHAKIKRNLKEIYQIEEHVQKILPNDIPHEYLDSKMPEMKNIVPVLEKSRLSTTMDQASVYERRLRNIDNFLQVIADTPELWSRDVLIFLGIDKVADQTIFIRKKLQRIQAKRRGIKMSEESEVIHNPLGLPFEENMSYHTNQSNLSSESFAIGIDKVNQMPENMPFVKLNSMNIEKHNFLVVKSEENKLSHVRKVSSGLEFRASISRWRESEGGDYIEYVIEFGSTVGQGKTWEIAKRYSDFVYIHHEILQTESEHSYVIPKLPPKIENKSVEQLNSRMQQLEDYLNAHLSELPINPIILEFIDFKKPESEFAKKLINMHIKEVDFEIYGKNLEMNKNNDLITLYEANINITPFNERVECISFTGVIAYSTLRKFDKELSEIADMGDLDISDVGIFPSRKTPDGYKIQDQELTELIQTYISTIIDNHSIINLFLFKKLMIDINTGNNKVEDRDIDLFGSVKNDTDIFDDIDKSEESDNFDEDE